MHAEDLAEFRLENVKATRSWNWLDTRMKGVPPLLIGEDRDTRARHHNILRQLGGRIEIGRAVRSD